ncbi:MAG: tetratricopeptide repeat protein [Verrucomicrobia bacterium]|nr:tetratricopeptide repeat protein [Verrucomicrobiota bacterium]
MRWQTWWRVVAFGLVVLSAASALAYEGDPEAARPINERARAAYGAGNYAEAAQLFAQTYQAYGHPEFLYNQAQCLRRAGQNEAALTAYQRYVDVGGPAAVAHIQIGECLTVLGRRDEARQAFERYLELEPEGPHATQAREAVDSGRPPSEQDRRDPAQAREAQAYYDRALEQYTSSNDLDAFVRAMTEGNERYHMPEFLASAARAYSFEERHQDAAAMYRRYVQTPGASADGWYDLGNALLYCSDDAGAVEAWRHYLQVAPQGQHAAEAGEMVHRLSQPGARATGEQVGQAREAVRLAREHYDAGRVAEALREFERAHGLANDRQIYFNICMCYTSLRRWPAAAQHWETYLESGEMGHDAVAHLFAAQAFLGQNNAASASRHIRRYQELAGQHELPNEAANSRWAEGMARDAGRGGSGGQ